MHGILFDLDRTLIDSAVAEHLRRARRWRQIYLMIRQLPPYPGISDLIEELSAAATPMAIVTSAPRPYCERVVQLWGWPISATICYHDTRHHKPDPAPLILGAERIGVTTDKAISVGDSRDDIIAARRAGMRSIGALWGAECVASLREAEPDYLCCNVGELRQVLAELLGRPER